jgi:hypothetical protein
VGGALPPSDADVNFSIRQLIRAGMPPDKIVAKVSQATKFVAKYVRRLVKDAQSSINKENLSKAIAAVGEGNLTARQAAKKFEVTFSSLKFLLGGKKKALDVQGLDEIKAGLTSRFRSLSGSNAKLIAPLLEGFGDGGVEEKVVRGTIDHFDHLIDNLARAAVNWRKRFDVAMKQKKKASA